MSVVVFRTIILYAMIVVALRVMGKRQLAELQPTELVVTLLISNIATLSIEDTNVPLLGSLLPIFALVSCEVLMSWFTLKNRTLRRLFYGNPIAIIRDGVINQKEMKNLRWSVDDLNEQLRMHNIFDVAEVSYAVVETSGTLSAYQKFGARQPTVSMMNIPQNGELDVPPLTIISDGELQSDALADCNLSEKWLEGILKGKGLTVKDVFIMTCNRRAEYFIAIKER